MRPYELWTRTLIYEPPCGAIKKQPDDPYFSELCLSFLQIYWKFLFLSPWKGNEPDPCINHSPFSRSLFTSSTRVPAHRITCSGKALKTSSGIHTVRVYKIWKKDNPSESTDCRYQLQRFSMLSLETLLEHIRDSKGRRCKERLRWFQSDPFTVNLQRKLTDFYSVYFSFMKKLAFSVCSFIAEMQRCIFSLTISHIIFYTAEIIRMHFVLILGGINL